LGIALPEINSSHLKMSHLKGKFIFQASIFREGFPEMFAQLIGKMVPNDHPGTLMFHPVIA